jgi:hypothetical protein
MIRKSKALRYSLLIASLAFAASSAHADINGFGDGSNYTLAGYTTSGSTIVNFNPPTISSGVLTITTASDSEARSAFYNIAQPNGAFVASFVYQNDPTSEPGLGAADGVAFVIQDDPRGIANTVGGGGASLGYGGSAPAGYSAITPSASVQLLLRTDIGTSSAYETNGDIGFADPAKAITTPVDLAGGDPILITLTYDGASTLTETFLDLTTAANFSTVVTNANIAATVGVSTAFVGFTGGTGGGFSTQTISNFTYVPEPASLSLLTLAAAPLLRRRRA